jgi:DNA-binding NtrC family response regulator
MSAFPSLLVIDDVPEFLQEVRSMLRPLGVQVTICSSPVRALRLARQKPFHLIITTLVMRELGGFELVRRLRGQEFAAPIVMITGRGRPETAIEATRLGVDDYIEKPVQAEELRARIEKALGRSGQDLPPAGEAVGWEPVSGDPVMQAILETLPPIARSDSRVLLLGETGTGKQVIAQAIHRASPRSARPFVEVNCAAIPAALLESELFGHERGAFTGASERRTGRFEEAGSGTLFLDEIGEMEPSLQAKLLGVLQHGRFSRVGGSATLQSKARLIAATNRNLQEEVTAGRFRADLFYRLQVISLTLPPLRRRTVDIPLLAAFFLRRFRREGGPGAFSPAALQLLQAYSWPGNIRELEHLIERLAVLCPKPVIEPGDLPAAIAGATLNHQSTFGETTTGGIPPLGEARDAFERAYLQRSLTAAKGNMAAAARIAAVDRSHFFRLIKRHGLDPAGFR